MRIFILDDNQDRHSGFRLAFPDDDLGHAYSYHQAVGMLQDSPQFDVAYLDHDLGDLRDGDKDDYGRELTGQDLARFIARDLDTSLIPGEVIIHSWNPVGARAMLQMLQDVVQVSCRPYTVPGQTQIHFK